MITDLPKEIRDLVDAIEEKIFILNSERHFENKTRNHTIGTLQSLDTFLDKQRKIMDREEV